MNSCIETFKSFTKVVRDQKILEHAIETASNSYSLRPYDIKQIDVLVAEQMFKSIQDKFYKKKPAGNSINWFENELRIFVWTLVCYTYLKGIKIQNMTDGNWEFFGKIFSSKDPKLFEYQCHSIYLSPQKAHIWVKDEDALLEKIIQEKQDKLKWNEISKELFEISEKKYFRTPKQCRERWNNHLDPKKIKGSWKIPECLKMFEYVRDEGKKWAKLVKVLDNSRDEHSIKNKFNSLFKKQKKMSPNFSDSEIYEIIIKRLNNTLNKRKDPNRNSETSFDINDMDDEIFPELRSNNQPRMLDVNPEPPHAFNYGEILRRKLMNFSSKPSKASIGTQASLSKATIEKNQLKQQIIEQNSLREIEYNMEQQQPIESVISSPSISAQQI